MEQSEEADDGQVIQLCLRGNGCAWNALVERKTATLFALLWYYLGAERLDRHLLEDLTQAVWFGLIANGYEQLRRYQQETGSFNTYLRQITLQEIQAHRRRKARQAHLIHLENHDRPDPGAESGLERVWFAEYEASLTAEEYAFLHHVVMKDAKEDRDVHWSPAKRWALTHRLKRKWEAHSKAT